MTHKKHKKSKTKEEDIHVYGNYVESEKKVKTENKPKQQEYVCNDSEQIEVEPAKHGKKKKKKKLYTSSSGIDGNPDQTCEELQKDGSSRKKKKHKKCQDDFETVLGCSEDQSDQVQDSQTSGTAIGNGELKHKKRKKRSKDTDSAQASSISATVLDDEPSKKRKGKTIVAQFEPLFLEQKQTSASKRKRSCQELVDIGHESDKMQMKRKKKEKKKTAEKDCQYVSQDSDVCPEENEQEMETGQEDKFNYDGSGSEKIVENGKDDLQGKSKKKKKKKHSNNLQETEVITMEVNDINRSGRKKKRKEKKENTDDGEKIIVEDSVNDNMHSGIDSTTSCIPEKDLKSESMPTTVGQWGTAGFESSDRQQKFLRLLGGFKSSAKGRNVSDPKKKGLYGSLFTAPGNRSGTSAMGLDQQKELEDKLTHQYEQALGLKLDPHRGGGLGYQRPPEEGKKFYINKNISSSKKFD